MNMIPNDSRIGLFLARITLPMSAEERRDLFRGAVIETGGDYTVPAKGDNWGPHLVELSLLGIHETGATEDLAIACWIATATDYLGHKIHAATAEHLLETRKLGVSDKALREAARTVLSWSHDAEAINAARAILNDQPSGAFA